MSTTPPSNAEITVPPGADSADTQQPIIATIGPTVLPVEGTIPPNTESLTRDQPTNLIRGRGIRRPRGARGPRRSSSRGSGRGTASRRNTNDRATPDPSQGWTLRVNDTMEVVWETDFVHSVFDERSRIFYRSAVSNLEYICRGRSLNFTRGGIVVCFIDAALKQVMEWMNTKTRLTDNASEVVSLSEMYQYLAVMICSHTTGLSYSKTVDTMQRFAACTPNLERVRWISENLLAFSPIGRGDDGAGQWICQRDFTPNLIELETLCFRETRRVYMNSSHMFATLDDDLFGTRANDNQVKSLSSRKADREGHSADAVADALTRIVLALRFRRRGEALTDALRQLLTIFFEGRGEQARSGFLITADRGYGKTTVLDLLSSFGVAALFVMPDHILRAHPFVAESYLNPCRGDIVDSDGDGDANHSSENVEQFMDRRRAFIVPDHPKLGNAIFAASKTCRVSGVGGATGANRTVSAVAVREHGTSKVCKVLRFIHSLPPFVTSEISKWIAVPKHGCFLGKTLFAGNENGLQKSCEDVLSRFCKPLTLAQRCADWFLLRQFRITGTNAGTILSKSTSFRQMVCLPLHQPDGKSQEEWFEQFYNSWFSDKVSTEPMMRGSANEAAVINFVRALQFVSDVFEIGMVATLSDPYLACSPDGIVLIRGDNTDSAFLAGNGDLSYGDETLWIASLEIKTKVASTTLGGTIHLSSSDVIFCDLGDNICHQYIPPDHLSEIVVQVTVLNLTFALYVVASETGVLFVVVLRVNASQRNVSLMAIKNIAEPLVSWAHRKDLETPPFVTVEKRDVVDTKLQFWQVVNDKVNSCGPFHPVKLFKHGTQTLYSKTKGGMDGATQQRAVLRSPTSHLKWEPKIVSQLIKTVCVNAFISWRLHERRDLLESADKYKSLDGFRHMVNKVQSTADFMFDAAMDLLIHANSLLSIPCTEDPNIETDVALNSSEQQALVQQAAKRKHNRLQFFNSPDGTTLRINVTGHAPRQGAYRYCALCGQNTGEDGKGWRGHRSIYSCSICSVSLCIKIHKGLLKSCWDLWHSNKKLRVRETPKITKLVTAGDEQQANLGDHDVTDDDPIDA